MTTVLDGVGRAELADAAVALPDDPAPDVAVAEVLAGELPEEAPELELALALLEPEE